MGTTLWAADKNKFRGDEGSDLISSIGSFTGPNDGNVYVSVYVKCDPLGMSEIKEDVTILGKTNDLAFTCNEVINWVQS